MDFSSLSLSSAPHFLWTCYVEYLWNYTPNSIVAKTAYSFKVLALALLLPILILILLDIASYTIARTLGVVDIVKASTSDKQTVHARREPPAIHIREASIDQSYPNTTSPNENNAHNPFFTVGNDSNQSMSATDSSRSPSDVRLKAYFTSGEHNLELSGVGVFSPATSRPPSPTISRRKLDSETQNTPSLHEFEIDDGSVHFRRRNKPTASWESIAQ
ncbi:hypothetical protein FB446DRAFT_764680 [Lentinula raphanica]|nr:hypothetical protein FB446DRAFT_764680 [Lentinula raphanica]